MPVLFTSNTCPKELEVMVSSSHAVELLRALNPKLLTEDLTGYVSPLYLPLFVMFLAKLEVSTDLEIMGYHKHPTSRHGHERRSHKRINRTLSAIKAVAVYAYQNKEEVRWIKVPKHTHHHHKQEENNHGW